MSHCFTQILLLFSFSVFVSSYWIGLSLIGFHYALISGAIVFTLPNSLILITFAYYDRRTNKHLINIITTFTSSSAHSANEDVLTFLLRIKLRIFAFGFVDFRFSSIGNVSDNPHNCNLLIFYNCNNACNLTQLILLFSYY